MSENIVKILVKVFTWSIMIVSVALAVLFFLGYINEAPFIVWAYLLTLVAAFLAVLFPIIFMFLYPKKVLKALGGIAIIGLIFLIGYVLADATPIKDISSANPNPNFANIGVLVYSDMGLIASYMLAGVAVLLLLFTGVRSIFSR